MPWKFVCHHHPPYSSDENDYGNLWKTNQGKHGDLRARELVPSMKNMEWMWCGMDIFILMKGPGVFWWEGG